ncbi:LptF/LptG family permease [Ruficoccus amylovorans]|uniref:LptF/LptG family permease n=1 Tax=Ruficoccus amylovorans TaxID=1804625 RepID=A0A842HI43_9BACT|nr:LptF/LptG family permease [Ruficoccus amylovorans]
MATVMAVAMFVFVLVAGNAIKEVLGLLASGRVSWGQFFYIMMILIPRVIPYAFPLGILTGVLLVLGRLSAQGEILAMKAAGISLYRIAAPIFLIAIGGTVFAVAIAFYYAPMADTLYKRTLANIVREDPLRFFQTRTFVKEFPGFVFYFDSRDGPTVHNLRVWVIDESNRMTRYLQSDSGVITFDAETDSIKLTVDAAAAENRSGSDVEDAGGLHTVTFGDSSFSIPLDGLFGSSNQERKLSYLNLNELLGKRQQYLDNTEGLPAEEQASLVNKVQTAIQKKAAMGVAVLSLCAIAIPLGIKASRSETYANLAIALGLALTYFFLLVIVSWLEKKPELRPDLLIWLPNLLYQGLGFYLLNRVNKH